MVNRKPSWLLLGPLTLFLLLTVTPCDSVAGQSPSGHYQGPTIQLPDSLLEVREGGRFRILIVRAAGDSLDQDLITRAESLYPPKSVIEGAYEGVTGSGHIKALQEAREVPGDRWWWREWDHVWLPFALTGAAVDHYVEHVRKLSVQPNPFREWNPGIDHTASVEYRASVESVPQGTEADHSMVHLQVRFEFYCGPLCALWFTHSRTVEFDELGSVVKVTGDEKPRYIVS